MNNDYITPMPIQVFAFGDVGADYTIVDVDGFDGPLRFLRFTSTLDESVIISFDGVNDHEFIFDDDEIDINAQLCSSPKNKRSLFKNKTKVYVKAAAGLPGSGAIVISGFYQGS
jgi:hypothetical protein